MQDVQNNAIYMSLITIASIFDKRFRWKQLLLFPFISCKSDKLSEISTDSKRITIFKQSICNLVNLNYLMIPYCLFKLQQIATFSLKFLNSFILCSAIVLSRFNWRDRPQGIN